MRRRLAADLFEVIRRSDRQRVGIAWCHGEVIKDELGQRQFVWSWRGRIGTQPLMAERDGLEAAIADVIQEVES